MVDCRPAAGAPPHELAHSAPNGGPPPPPPPENNHHNQLNQGGGNGDMGPAGHAGVASPAARASTPASNAAIPQYGPGVNMGAMNMGAGGGMSPLGYAPYYGGGKALGGVVWMPPPLPPPLPPLPQHVNPHVFKSIQPNGSDLPMNDLPTLRYYFNLGVDCMWAAYGPPPPRPYPPRDIAQDMQQMSLNERGCAAPMERHKPHAPPDKSQLQGKGNGQRSLLGPRFNKRGNQDGNQNSNHNQNKGHNNNNMANKGPNNRRNSHEVRAGPVPYGDGGGECMVDAGLMSMPYISYPPPLYPMQYYALDSNDPAMMGMMGGMGYVNYEETGEYAPYYPPAPLYPPHLPPAPPTLHHHAPEHK